VSESTKTQLAAAQDKWLQRAVGERDSSSFRVCLLDRIGMKTTPGLAGKTTGAVAAQLLQHPRPAFSTKRCLSLQNQWQPQQTTQKLQN
jgi:hypothetical protein